MKIDLNELLEHDDTEDCPVCQAQSLVQAVLIPAAAAWELNNDLPRYSLALHGAAGLLGAMLEEGVPRVDVESALGKILDDIEMQIAENGALGGPTQGSA